MPLQSTTVPFIFSQDLDPDLMASSLTITLRSFPIFAGRLVTDVDKDNAIELNGRGAALTVATSGAMLADVLPEGISCSDSPPSDCANNANSNAKYPRCRQIPTQDLSIFLPKAPRMGLSYRCCDVPLFHAQVTALRGGGTVLALVVPHFIADQATIKTVLHEWANNYTAVCGAVREITLPGKRKEVAEAFVQATFAIFLTDPDTEAMLLGNALAPHVASELPPGWTSRQFERLPWNFFCSYISTLLWTRLAYGPAVAVTYYIPAARLAELKEEASQTSSSISEASGWISTRDALAARISQIMSQLFKKYGKKELLLLVDLRKRLVPELNPDTLGNCSWPIKVPIGIASTSHSSSLNADITNISTGSHDISKSSPSLSILAREIRAAINTVAERDEISKELRWLEGNVHPGAASFPITHRNIPELFKPSGPFFLSNWTWGDSGFDALQFGGGPKSMPIWHQPGCAVAPNIVMVAPAAAAAPDGGLVVRIMLHNKFAKQLKREYPNL